MSFKRLLPVFGTLLCLAPRPLLGKEQKDLDFKAIRHYQITLERSLLGVYREGATVIAFPAATDFYLRSDYKETEVEPDLGFGSLHDPYDRSERVEFDAKGKKRLIHGLIHASGRLAFLDSPSRQLLIWDEARKAWQLPADLILDTPKPPRDARGEPTRAETAALRARLAKSLARQKAEPDLISGITAIPKGWRDRDGSQYVIWMQNADAPLLTLKCDLQTFKVCEVQRACFVKGLRKGEPSLVTSIALDPKSDELLLLEGSEKKIRRMKGDTCHGLRAEDAYQLPAELAFAQGIFVDDARNLWLALSQPEGSTSASLFTWAAARW